MTRTLVPILGFGLLLSSAVASSAAGPEPSPRPRTLEPLTAGPVHEAFLSMRGDQPPRVLPQSPPPPVIERPAVEAADSWAIWIGGYWDWVDDRNDFVWVTGTWRVPPPGRLWVNGYWKRDDQGWRRIPGFWSDRRTSRLDYRAEGPPTVRPPEDPGSPPKANCFYIPGEYVPKGSALVWKPGYWADAQPGWSWTPARWIRQPEGWVFQNGFWDRPLERRGVLFAPAALAGKDDESGPLFYSPYTIVSPELYGQLYGAFGRDTADYDGYAGASYDDDGRYYMYADYGMLSNYYGYLDYPNLGAYGYPYYVTPLIYESLGYSYPTGLIGGIYYGGLGYGIGGLGLGIVNPGWGFPIWSGGWGRPSWTGNGWAGPSWGSWPGWPWGFPGWGWNWYWPTWAGNGWAGPSWGSIGGFPLSLTDYGWGGFGFGGIGSGFGGLGLGAFGLGFPYALMGGDPPATTKPHSLPFQNTGARHVVRTSPNPGAASSGLNLPNQGAGTMRGTTPGLSGLAAQGVKPPPSSRPFASLSTHNLASIGHMRAQSPSIGRPGPSESPAMRRSVLATGAGSWNHTLNGAMRTPALNTTTASNILHAGNAPAGFGRMRSAVGVNPAANLNPSVGFRSAMRGGQSVQQLGAMNPNVALQGMRNPGFAPQSRALTGTHAGLVGITAPGGPNFGAMGRGGAAISHPGLAPGGAMLGGLNPGSLNPGFAGGAMRGGLNPGGMSSGFTGGAMRGGSLGGLSAGHAGSMFGGSLGGLSPGFSGGAMRGGSLGGSGFGGGMPGGGFGGGMGGGMHAGGMGAMGGGGFGASGFGGGFGAAGMGHAGGAMR